MFKKKLYFLNNISIQNIIKSIQIIFLFSYLLKKTR